MKVSKLNTDKFQRYSVRILTLILALGLNGFLQNAQAQTAFKAVAGSQIKVNGTSNLHDWTMAASSFNCTASATVKGDQLQDITALSFVLPVTNLKAKEDLMNTRAYKALNQEKYNQITFKLTDAVISGKTVKATGNLTISGVTNPVTLQANYAVNGDEVVFKGSKAIKMSDFKIKAPSFMMGALKTGDEVTIDLALKLKN